MVPNPYGDKDLAVLASACSSRAVELEGASTMSSLGQAELLEDVSWLLRALAIMLEVGAAESPETRVEALLTAGSPLQDRYLRWADSANRRNRHWALLLATDRHLGPAERHWYRGDQVGGVPALQLAVASDEGLQLVLAHLAAKPGLPAS